MGRNLEPYIYKKKYKRIKSNIMSNWEGNHPTHPHPLIYSYSTSIYRTIVIREC